MNAHRDSHGNQGFTLLELMIVVAIIGILAAIAIPAFINYQNRSRRAEAFTNLGAIATMQKTYFSEYNAYTPPILPEPGTSSGTLPGTTKRRWTPAADLAYSTLGWRPEGEVYYDYEVNSGVACPAADCFTAAAYGDADGDLDMAILQYVQPNAAGVTEMTLVLPFGPPVDPVTGRVQLNEVVVNYAADQF